MKKQPLPPFGRRVDALVKSGRTFRDGQRCVWVACGSDTWAQGEKARTWNHEVLVLPPDEDPRNFRWPVCGVDVVVIVGGRIDRGTLEALGTALVQAGSPLVVVCDSDNETLGGPLFTFKPRRKAA